MPSKKTIERARREAENHPTVRLLRELATKPRPAPPKRRRFRFFFR